MLALHEKNVYGDANINQNPGLKLSSNSTVYSIFQLQYSRFWKIYKSSTFENSSFS